jgi:hypothetical protein
MNKIDDATANPARSMHEGFLESSQFSALLRGSGEQERFVHRFEIH